VLTAIIIFIVFTSVVLILWVGSHDVLTGSITPGRLGQFILYAAFAATGLGQLSEVWGEVSAASGASERLFEILRVKSAISAPASPRALPMPPRGDVSFDNVRFAYPTRPDVMAVDGVSLSVRAGEKVAIVGPSGAGKSTLFHLLLRFYDPAQGQIAIDGVPVRNADPREVRSRIALVPQDAVAFAATARENIRFGRPDATDAEVDALPISPMPPNSSAGCRAVSRRSSASAASRCRAASASASPSRARSCATRRYCCSTRPPRRSTPNPRRWCRPRWRN